MILTRLGFYLFAKNLSTLLIIRLILLIYPDLLNLKPPMQLLSPMRNPSSKLS